MDDLERTVELLRKSLAAAWRDLAQSSSSAVDRREMRAQAKRCSEELRRCLLIIEARQTRKHAKALSDYDGRALPKPGFRFLGITDQ
ncbi:MULTISPECIES: hypothetical protein [unclassified Bradyrhizobium]|uniref:hypothetical protein n=1 Tax=unclassified Bradyrhizobium TaxID=2631580 RepID=UPI00188B7E93|nr:MULTISPECIES: hypothetical protein [unclassified Bradyrhizobium]MDN4988478.1 hypothetical protein [Bradyrhizobium sp. WYCCWR 13022]QOZ52194.1 hypothetical protein XH90_13050 [Bradyrhizobium sp. CCBAU 53338]